MITVFIQIFILLLFIGVGFILGKTRLIKAEESKILSTLLVYVFLPSNIIKTFADRFNIGYLTDNLFSIAISTAIILILAVGAHFGLKLLSKNKYERSVLEYAIVVPNSGYMGYPLAEVLYGTAGLMSIMTMALPLQLYIYTYAYAILTKSGLNLKKLINPVIIATVIGMVLGLLEVPIPELADSILNTSSACMAPVSMILAGLVVSEFKFRDIALDPKVYLVSAIKLLVIPLVIGAICMLFFDKTTMAITVLLYSLPCGMNSVIFPKLVGEDCRTGAGVALISTICSALTIPLIFWIFGL